MATKGERARLSSLHASWHGSPTGPHSGLRGTFDGTLTQQGGAYVYTGRFSVTEGSAPPGTGTMTFVIVAANRISLSVCCPQATYILTRTGGGHVVPVQVNFEFHAQSQPTNPPLDGGKCVPQPTPAIVTGSFNGGITDPDLRHFGSGTVTDTPHLNRCRVPRIIIDIDHITVETLRVNEPPGTRAVRATMQVHIRSEAVHQPGQCQPGTRGTVVVTYDDTSTAANGWPNNRLEIGLWTAPCNAHNHVITNNISSIPALGSGSTWVKVFIGCLGRPDQGGGYGPRNCGS